MFFVPRVSGDTVSRSFCGASHGKLIHICFSNNDHSRLLKTVDNLCLILGNKALQDLRRAGGWLSLYADVVLYRNGNAGKRACVDSLVNAFLHLFCTGIGFFFVGVQVGVDLPVLFLNLGKDLFYPVQDTDLMFFYFISQLQGC